MVKALKIIADFVTENWLILFFILTLFAAICLIILTVRICRTVAASNDIPNARAAAENEYYIEKIMKESEENCYEEAINGTNESDDIGLL